MQRLFSMFPNGWPGRGLLVLRIGTGILLLHEGAGVLLLRGHALPDVFVLLAALAGLLLFFGLWTPFAGFMLACEELGLLLVAGSDPVPCLLYTFIGVALACVGPGVWSIDALFFGRKRIDIPER